MTEAPLESGQGRASDQFLYLSEYIMFLPSRPRSIGCRMAQIEEVGAKACGLALLPQEWSPPFVVVSAAAYVQWRRLGPTRNRSAFLDSISEGVVGHCSGWEIDWPAGLALRSSAVAESIRERGAHVSVKTTADYGVNTLSSILQQIFESFSQSDTPGTIAVIVQARVETTFSGQMSNERRVSKTVNQWMWEADEPLEGGERFNSQRVAPPNATLPLWLHSPHRTTRLKRLLQQIGRWCTHLKNGPCHLEWGISGEILWIFQIDFEDDQPDSGVDPRNLLAAHDVTPSGAVPAGSPFKQAEFGRSTDWAKIDKVREFLINRTFPYPSLYYATGKDIDTALSTGRDFASDIREIAGDAAVCRIDCRSKKIGELNLPRTDTVSALSAAEFVTRQVAEMRTKGVDPSELCFIIHKFIPARVAAWALARPDRQLVLVDSI